MDPAIPAESVEGMPSRKQRYYLRLFLRFCLFSLVCAIIPVTFMAAYNYHSYSRFSNERMVQSFQRRVESSRGLVELFLKERLLNLQTLVQIHSVDFLKQESNLKLVFDAFNNESEYFEDLGLINQRGFHESYVGPYDLMANDYSVTFWFKALMEKGFFVSDMFMGYRKIPHFIVAVLKEEQDKKWILRATIDTEALSSMLAGITIDKTGEVFLLNAEGYYQTATKSGGRIMEKSVFDMASFPGESGIEIFENTDSDEPTPKIVAYSWLKNPRWLLIVQQDYSEFFADRDFAGRATFYFLGVSALSIFLVVALSVTYIVRTIMNRDRELAALNRQLVQAGKLASLGQLAAGVAHEINNPLAVIQSEVDIIREFGEPAENGSRLGRSLEQIEAQVQRCSKIIRNLLGFSRRIKSEAKQVDVTEVIREVIVLFQKWAGSAGIDIVLDLKENLPKISGDSFEIGQVLVNLIGNAIDALEGKQGGTIRIKTGLDSESRSLFITVADTGCGIPQADIDSIFDPFFTTKPVGKGSGLGLSISYSIVKNMGGEIAVRSEAQKGTEFTLSFPLEVHKTRRTGDRI